MTLFILAAGMGSRYGGTKPKQIDPMTPHGEFIIDFSIYDAMEAGFDRIVFVIKEENYNDFVDTVGKRIANSGLKTEYVFQKMNTLVPAEKIPAERTKPWGTTHALLCAEEALNESFAIVNSDDFYGKDAFFKAAEFLRNAKNDEAHFAMVGYKLSNTLSDHGSVNRGECLADENGMLQKIHERCGLTKEEGGAYYENDNGDKVHLGNDVVVSMNFWCFTPPVFAGLKADFAEFIADPATNLVKGECLLPDTIGKMIEAGDCDVKVLTTTACWVGVTRKEDKPIVQDTLQNLIQQGDYPDGLWK